MSPRGWSTSAVASVARSARRCRRAATFVAAAGAAAVADLFGVVAGKRKRTSHGVPTTRVLEAHLVHFVQRNCVAVVHVGNKVAISLLMTVRRRQE
jgi:phosphoribosylcarboxyaminoimidazole (NCAIR) mutase